MGTCNSTSGADIYYFFYYLTFFFFCFIFTIYCFLFAVFTIKLPPRGPITKSPQYVANAKIQDTYSNFIVFCDQYIQVF